MSLVDCRTHDDLLMAKGLLRRYAYIKPTEDFCALMWMKNGEPQWVVGYDGFLGSVCQIHVVNVAQVPAPRMLVWATFHFPFVQRHLKAVLAVINSHNADSMRFTEHVGFSEIHRIPEGHDDGGDIVLKQLNKDDCKWLQLGDRYEKLLVAA